MKWLWFIRSPTKMIWLSFIRSPTKMKWVWFIRSPTNIQGLPGDLDWAYAIVNSLMNPFTFPPLSRRVFQGFNVVEQLFCRGWFYQQRVVFLKVLSYVSVFPFLGCLKSYKLQVFWNPTSLGFLRASKLGFFEILQAWVFWNPPEFWVFF